MSAGPGSVGVIGAGLTGLAAACELGRRGVPVTVYEAAGRVGGVVRSERRDGYLVEHGPHSFGGLPPRAAALLTSLGLDAQMLAPAPAARRRYVVRGGRPVALPSAPLGALTSPLLSVAGKLRVLREPFVPAGDPAAEESVADFVRRRLGGEVLDALVDPMLAGICAGRPEQLAMRHALPRLHALEREHGSLLRGLRRARGAGMAASRAARSFADGMETLPRTLAVALRGELRLGTAVCGIRPAEGGWELAVRSNDGGDEVVRHEAIVYAAPAWALEGIAFGGAEAALVPRIAELPYAPVALLTLGFRREDVRHPLDGFGCLVPAAERRRILGVIFASSLFPGRAPAGHVALAVFIGGARDPRLAEADAHTLTGHALADLDALFGIRGEPAFRRHLFRPKAIPQYIVGFGRLAAAMAALERANPGLLLAGTYRDGIAVGEALASGVAAAERAATVSLGRRGGA